MQVRLADAERDFAGIMDGARDFVSRVECKECLPDNDDDLIDAVCRVIDLPGAEVVIAEHESRVVGGICMLYGPALWRPKNVSATEVFWWTATDSPPSTALRLIRFTNERIAAHGAVLREFMCLETSPDSIRKVYAAMGLRKAQEVWIG